MSFVRQHKGAVVWSLALHVAVLAGVVIGLPWFETPRAPVASAVVPIEAVMIDTAALERAQMQRDDAARQERQRQQREERQQREAAEQQRQTEQREQQRVANEQRARDERVAADKAEQARKEEQARVARERQAREQREKDAQAQKEREENAKRERERSAQRQREEDMLRAAAVEAEANAARSAGLFDQYISMLENRIKQNWDRPLSARPGIDCTVNVVQLPTGDVVSAVVASCNGDDAVRRSIERAVMEASPLPKPPNAALFERNLNVRFQPDE